MSSHLHNQQIVFWHSTRCSHRTPVMTAAVEQKAFIAAASEVVERKIYKHRLLSVIYETTRASVGLPVDPSSDAVVMFRVVLAEGRYRT